MPISFNKENDNEGKGAYLVTERLYVNADKSAIVPEDSPEAAYLLATPGKRLSAEEAKKYGLKAIAPKSNKAVMEPPTDKGQSDEEGDPPQEEEPTPPPTNTKTTKGKK